ncbi:helix-turn-helix transcriptional regulator [Granulosicoccaceae sp. 1_MG-2023]|nr:helix-turn-helix transcriptional regulator [Granulosicoccaceae sp. 1_MG-2023]
MQDHFAANLRLLCSYYRSIADVCRRLNINRSQFNRYLSGRSRPSAHTLRRFCDFFGVEEYEILLPNEQFQRLIKVRPNRPEGDAPGTPAEQPETPHLRQLGQMGTAGLSRYLGYYFENYMSMAHPGKILRTLVKLEQRDEGVYFQRTERVRERDGEAVCHGVYLGMAHFLTDRIFLVDYESLTGHEITETILFPTFKNRVTRLSGLKLGVSGTGERMPSCARVVYEYLGPQVDTLRALSLCGLYAPDSAEIDAVTVNAVRNDMAAGDVHFRARH